MDAKNTVTAKYGSALLAGGAGKRMGGANKATLEYSGKSFIERICPELEKTGSVHYLSAANYEQDLSAGWKLVRDSVTSDDGKYTGPAGGIFSCLSQAKADGLEGVFFAPCDAPFFAAKIHEKLADCIDDDTDAVCWKTGDGRVQTTFGWYSVRCIDAFRDDIEKGRYKVLRILENLRYRAVSTENTGISDRCFMNINDQDDYRMLTKKRHILICGKRQVGKTTLINRITENLDVPVYGYRTKIFRDSADGTGRVYMYPADGMDEQRAEDNYVGSTRGKVLDVRTETFEDLGTALIRKARPDGIIVMDEIGFMEQDSAGFCAAVREAFDGDIPVLASVKDTDRAFGHIDMIRNHPGAELMIITEENRDEVFMQVKKTVDGWIREILAKRGADA